MATAYPVLLPLLSDADPEVRRAAPTALLACRRDSAQVASALQARLSAEPDGQAREVITTALGALLRRASAGTAPGVDAAGLAERLAAIVADHDEATLRLTALAELARSAPAALPPDVVPAALALLDEVYVENAPPPPSAGFVTDTMLSARRERMERTRSGRPAPAAGPLVSAVSEALGDRIEERVEFLSALLRSSGWERRYDAIFPARSLMQDWRGGYDDLVLMIGQQLLDGQPRLCREAARTLEDLDELVAPAADALVAALEIAPRQAPYQHDGGLPPWIVMRASSLPRTGAVLKALVALGDPRALPMVRWALDHEDMPEDLGFIARGLGASAGELVPLLRQRLRDLPTVVGYDMRRYGLVALLAEVGAAALPAMPELLALLPESGRPRTALVAAIGTLGSHAPGSTEAEAAAAALRPLVRNPHPGTALDAALALWRVEGDPAAVLKVFAKHLRGDQYQVAGAADGLVALGPAAVGQAARLRATLAEPDPHWWRRVHAAEALWRVTGDASDALPVLRAAWTGNPATRRHVARCWERMGVQAASCEPLLRAELAGIRRHNARGNGTSSAQVQADQELLRTCARALAAITRQN